MIACGSLFFIGQRIGADLLVLQHHLCCSHVAVAYHFKKGIAKRALLVADVTHSHRLRVAQRKNRP